MEGGLDLPVRAEAAQRGEKKGREKGESVVSGEPRRETAHQCERDPTSTLVC